MSRTAINLDAVIAENLNAIMAQLHKVYGTEATRLCAIHAFQGNHGLNFYIYAFDKESEKDEKNGENNTVYGMKLKYT